MLDGGAGADTMTGGAGNDTYVVDNAGDAVDRGSRRAASTRCRRSVSFTLGANVENLTLTGAAAINGTGNALANTLTGNAAANILDGGVGADTMTGGAGNDTYVVDNAGDVVDRGGRRRHRHGAELASAFTLGANVENLTLTGTGAINGTGNALANIAHRQRRRQHRSTAAPAPTR